MPSWCTNKLKVSGNKESMKRFFEILNSKGNSDFQMSKFFPIPIDDLWSTVLPDFFYPVSKIVVVDENGNFEIIVLDHAGRTEEEFDIYLSDLEKNYTRIEWSLDNWGCRSDVRKQKDISLDLQHYSVTYETPWSPNLGFVIDLHLWFSNLFFTLDYFEVCSPIAGNLTITPEKIDYHEKPLNIACFNLDIVTNKYVFDNKFANIYWRNAIGKDWINSLAESGCTRETVKNWDEVHEYINSVDNK